jgi:hypothetical protein
MKWQLGRVSYVLETEGIIHLAMQDPLVAARHPQERILGGKIHGVLQNSVVALCNAHHPKT